MQCNGTNYATRSSVYPKRCELEFKPLPLVLPNFNFMFVDDNLPFIRKYVGKYVLKQESR